jgi:hypothetical protein
MPFVEFLVIDIGDQRVTDLLLNCHHTVTFEKTVNQKAQILRNNGALFAACGFAFEATWKIKKGANCAYLRRFAVPTGRLLGRGVAQERRRRLIDPVRIHEAALWP